MQDAFIASARLGLHPALEAALEGIMLTPDLITAQPAYYLYCNFVEDFLQNDTITAEQIVENDIAGQLTSLYIKFLESVVSKETPNSMRIFPIAAEAYLKCIHKVANILNENFSRFHDIVDDAIDTFSLSGYSAAAQADLAMLEEQLSTAMSEQGSSQIIDDGWMETYFARLNEITQRSLETGKKVHIAVIKLINSLIVDHNKLIHDLNNAGT